MTQTIYRGWTAFQIYKDYVAACAAGGHRVQKFVDFSPSGWLKSERRHAWRPDDCRCPPPPAPFGRNNHPHCNACAERGLVAAGSASDPTKLTGTTGVDQAPKTDNANAQKKDMGKAPIWQGFMNYFPRAIIAVALVSEYGKRKYAPDAPTFNSGWSEVTNGLLRYLDADMRHALKRAISSLGEYDEESDMAHLAHKAWNAMAELERAIIDGVVECRYGNEIKDGQPVPGTWKKVEL